VFVRDLPGVRQFLSVRYRLDDLEVDLLFGLSLGSVGGQSTVIIFSSLSRWLRRSAGLRWLGDDFDISLRVGLLEEALFRLTLRFWLRSVSVAAPKAHQPSTTRSDTLQSSLV